MVSTQKYLKSSVIFPMQLNYVLLRNNFSQFKNIFQYVYFNVYPELYCSTGRWGFDPKSTFHIVFKACKGKKKGRASEEKSTKFCTGKERNLHF